MIHGSVISYLQASLGVMIASLIITAGLVLFLNYVAKKTGNMVFHTAGLAFALKKVWDENRFKSSKNIIFLTIGSGINVSIALYQN